MGTCWVGASPNLSRSARLAKMWLKAPMPRAQRELGRRSQVGILKGKESVTVSARRV